MADKCSNGTFWPIRGWPISAGTDSFHRKPFSPNITEYLFHRISPNTLFTECRFHRKPFSPKAAFTESRFHRKPLSPKAAIIESRFHRKPVSPKTCSKPNSILLTRNIGTVKYIIYKYTTARENMWIYVVSNILPNLYLHNVDNFITVQFT